MNLDQSVQFLQALGAEKIHVVGEKVTARCPLARWKHKKGHDSTPSFGLFIKAGDRSFYNCFVCGSGSAEELIGALELYTVEEEKHLYDFTKARLMLEEELAVVPLPDYMENATKQQPFSPWPLWWLDSFVPAPNSSLAMEYLTQTRKNPVSIAVIQEFNLRYDTAREMIVCPYFNVYGQFAGARGRCINPKTHLQHYDYSFGGLNNASMTWYNEPALNISGWVVTVEGQFDVMRTQIAWKKTVGNLTAMPTWEKFKKLCESDGIVHIPDPDAAGEASIVKCQKFAYELKVPYKVLHLPVQEGVKIDPDLCHPQYLFDRIKETING